MSSNEKLNYAELVDVGKLQDILDGFYQAVGLANAVIDVDGTIIAHAGWQDACTRFHRINPETCRRCLESDTALAESAMQGLPFGIYNCLNGLVDAVAPIVVDGKHLANVFVGQFLTSPPDMGFFRKQAQQFGFDEAQYLDAISRLPIISREKAESFTRLYAQLAGMLADNGLDRLKRKQAMNELASRSLQLELANKELEEFSYSMSHDMRTPLRALDGYSKILLEDYGGTLDEEGLRLLKVIRDNARRTGRLLDDILHFLNQGRRKVEYRFIDVSRLAHEICASIGAGAAGQRLRFIIGELPPVWGDYAMIREVLQNLLSNAVKFSPKEGEVLVEVSGHAEGGEIIYSVRDHGIGFDMQYADKLFKVFERVHATGQFEGSGIGLAIVKRIVMRHGGRVWADGEVGKGATFYFALPQEPPADAPGGA